MRRTKGYLRRGRPTKGERLSLQEALEAIAMTPRERELLRLYAQGYTSREIADKWRRSIRTVQFHRMNLYQTYGVHSLLRLLQAHYREERREK